MSKYMYEHYDMGALKFDCETFRCGKGYYSNSINIFNFVWTLIPKCWFENLFRAYFGTEIS
jgi:hypothetical protein